MALAHHITLMTNVTYADGTYIVKFKHGIIMFIVLCKEKVIEV